MPFVALSFIADAASAEPWADALLQAGALAIDTADPNAGSDAEVARYDEPGSDGADLWPLCMLSALFADDGDAVAALDRASALLGVPVPAHRFVAVADDDWVRKTQQQFQPLCVAPGLWIVPSWGQPVDTQAINLRLDPGLAFGTGSHPTTRMCLRWLAQNLSAGETMLDYGCGSGILAIAAAKLGAASVVGVDVDAQAIAASRDNARLNSVAAHFHLPDASLEGKYDVVVANILANPLQLLAPLLAAHVRTTGHVVLSGILELQAPAVMAAYAPWFTIDVWNSDEGWVALAGIRLNDDG
jgi:ribosomal protein L11 methyltransferase